MSTNDISDPHLFLAKLKSEVERTWPQLIQGDETGKAKVLASNFRQFTLGELNELFAGRFQCISILSSGDMSVIFKARSLVNRKFVAVKMLPVRLDPESVSYQRFVREAKALSCLTHPNIITFHDFGHLEVGQAYFVMDYVDGESLAAVLKREGPLSLVRSLLIFSAICSGMIHAHEMGVLHRDLKPSNIMLVPCSDGSDAVRIVDFGLAKLMPGAAELHQELTKSGEIFGTPFYMSPEQCSGKPIDERSDIYALGCLMYEAITGKPPHVGETSLATLLKHLSSDAVPPSVLRRDIQLVPQMEEMILKTLQKNPDDRYQSMNELRQDIAVLESRLSSAGLKRAIVSKTPTREPSTFSINLPQSQFWVMLGVTVSMFMLSICILFATLTHF